MHTLYRFFMSTASYLTIVAAFAAWGWLASFATQSHDILIFAAGVAAIFFAPCAYANTWRDIGD